MVGRKEGRRREEGNVENHPFQNMIKCVISTFLRKVCYTECRETQLGRVTEVALAIPAPVTEQVWHPQAPNRQMSVSE